MIRAYWSGTAGEFRKLSFTEWVIEACANAAIMNVMTKHRALEVKHL